MQAFRGHVAIEVLLGDNSPAVASVSNYPSIDISIADLMKLIDDSIKEFSLMQPIIIIDARYVSGFDRDETREFALISKQRGMVVIAKLDGLSYQAFAEHANYTVAYAESGWLNYKANEIVYQQRDGFPFKLPEIYSLNQDARFTIYLDKKESKPEWMAAYIKQRLPWAIITKPAFTYEVKLL